MYTPAARTYLVGKQLAAQWTRPTWVPGWVPGPRTIHVWRALLIEVQGADTTQGAPK